jgi:hypothetical protein
MESVRMVGWKPSPESGAVKVPQTFEYRYCPKDMGHWRVSGDTCPVCKSKVRTLSYVAEPKASA